MKKILNVSFSVDRDQNARFQRLLRSIGCIEGWDERTELLRMGLAKSRPGLSHKFEEDDPRLESLFGLLRKEGVKWSERREYKYTDNELRSFPLLNLTVDRKPLDAGGPNYGTTYDLSNACPRCGTGALQNSPLLLPLVGLPKRGLLCEAGMGETLVSERLAMVLQKARLTGLELRQVRFYRNDEPLPWWQMIGDFDLPKMSPRTKGVITDEVDHVMDDGMVVRALPPCPKCQRDGRYGNADVPCEIVYSRMDFNSEKLPDVVHTWERFGVSGIDKEKPQFSRFAPPLILVKPKIFDIFRALKVKHARFEPVRFED